MSTNSIIATLPAANTSNGHDYQPEKELVSAYSVVALDPNGAIVEPVTLCICMARARTASVAYASLWVRDRVGDRYYAGHGQAGGYGYHRASAAADEAIHSAGITLSRGIGGVGESAIQEALLAIATALGYSNATMITH